MTKKMVKISFWVPDYYVKNLEAVADYYVNISWSRLMRMLCAAG
jgi:hypothetical protein